MTSRPSTCRWSTTCPCTSAPSHGAASDRPRPGLVRGARPLPGPCLSNRHDGPGSRKDGPGFFLLLPGKGHCPRAPVTGPAWHLRGQREGGSETSPECPTVPVASAGTLPTGRPISAVSPGPAGAKVVSASAPPPADYRVSPLTT